MLRTEIFSFLRLTESILIGRLLEIGGITQATKVWKLVITMILQIFRGINTLHSIIKLQRQLVSRIFFRVRAIFRHF